MDGGLVIDRSGGPSAPSQLHTIRKKAVADFGPGWFALIPRARGLGKSYAGRRRPGQCSCLGVNCYDTPGSAANFLVVLAAQPGFSECTQAQLR